MKFWKRSFDYVRTGGVSEDIRSLVDDCNTLLSKLRPLIYKAEQKQNFLRSSLINLGGYKRLSYQLLRRAANLINRSTERDRREMRRLANSSLARKDAFQNVQSAQLMENAPDFEYDSVKITASIDSFEQALQSIKGAGLGGVTGLGAWGLVSSFGTASTGTAIGGLTGIAAHNATLAWFGGGALAAGGAGMAGGVLVLGGLVALPFVGFAIRSGYKAAKKERERLQGLEKQLQCSLLAYETYVMLLDNAQMRCDFVFSEIASKSSDFEPELESFIDQFLPIPYLSHCFRTLRKWFTGRYFRDAELNAVISLSHSALKLLEAFERQIFNEKAEVAQQTKSAVV